MNLEKILSELWDEKRRIDDAISALERISAATPKRRGRPPAWLKKLNHIPSAAVLEGAGVSTENGADAQSEAAR
jgi:hypothetical protein